MSLGRSTPSSAGVFSSSIRIYKLVLLGESAVGKSSVALRFVKKEFHEYMESTIGASFLTQHLTLPDHSKIKLDIWDTAGQERYRALAPLYYRGAKAAIVVYDVSSPQSFEAAKAWIVELQQKNPTAIVALLANKQDLPIEQHKVNNDEAQAYATKNNLLFFATSAKQNFNIDVVFQSIVAKLPIAQQLPSNTVAIDQVIDTEQKKSCCK